jgi:hypothetical protein
LLLLYEQNTICFISLHQHFMNIIDTDNKEIYDSLGIKTEY